MQRERGQRDRVFDADAAMAEVAPGVLASRAGRAFAFARRAHSLKLLRRHWIGSIRLPPPSRLGSVSVNTPSSSFAFEALSSISHGRVKLRTAAP
jgi:hypothetical protein